MARPARAHARWYRAKPAEPAFAVEDRRQPAAFARRTRTRAACRHRVGGLARPGLALARAPDEHRPVPCVLRTRQHLHPSRTRGRGPTRPGCLRAGLLARYRSGVPRTRRAAPPGLHDARRNRPVTLA